VAGVEQDRGLATFGLLWTPAETFSFGLVNHYVDDLLNILYAESSWETSFFDRLGVKLDVRFTDQLSVGRDLLTGSSTHTYHLGFRASTSLEGALLAAGFATTGDQHRIRSPWGSDPSFVNRMHSNFDKADEEAWFVALSYHFGRIGLEPLSIAASYTEGWDANDADGASIPHRREVNLTLDYRVQGGLLRGLWLRARAAIHNENGAEETGHDLRIILNYEIPIF